MFKSLLITFFASFTLATASAQFVIVNSPPSIAGSKDFSAAGFGADLTTDIWTGDVVLVDDGTALPNEGCMAATNAAEIAGKIALVDRGTCEFGVKCLNAEMAGAIAVVVFNSLPNAGAGTIVMGAGAVGINVTIPAVMLSYEEGQIIRAEMMNGPVNMTIGNVQFPNDLRIARDRIHNFPLGVVPAKQAEAANLTFTPAANVLNRGTEDASDVVLQGTISFTPFGGAETQVYDESDGVLFLESDSAALIELPVYIPDEGEGVYSLNYQVSASVDDSPEVTGDNEAGSQFVLSNNIFSKASWDLANNRPNQTSAFTIAGGGPIEFLSGFHMPLGVGFRLDSLQLYVATLAAGPTLEALTPNSVNGFVYEWIDANVNGVVTEDELILVALAPVDLSGLAVNSAWLTVPILDFGSFDEGYIIPEDDVRFFVGVRYEGAEQVFFGFDESYDQTVLFDHYAQTDLDFPYLGANTWNGQIPSAFFLFGGVRGGASHALIIGGEGTSSSVDKAPVAADVVFLPNPANDFLTVETTLLNSTSSIEYTIRDMAGRQIFNLKKDMFGTFDKTRFNVSQLAAGQYFLTLKTADGNMSKMFSVQH